MVEIKLTFGLFLALFQGLKLCLKLHNMFCELLSSRLVFLQQIVLLRMMILAITLEVISYKMLFPRM